MMHQNSASPQGGAGAHLPGTVWNAETAAVIETSHRRSEGYGLCPGAKPDYAPLARNDLSLLVEQNRLLHTHAAPAMETLYQQIVNTHNMVLLTDANGVIVHSLGDADFLEKANRVALTPGRKSGAARMRSAPPLPKRRRPSCTRTSTSSPRTTS